MSKQKNRNKHQITFLPTKITKFQETKKHMIQKVVNDLKVYFNSEH